MSARGSRGGRGRGGYRGKPFWMKKKITVPATPVSRDLEPSPQSSSADSDSPYKGWKLYFPDERYKAKSDLSLKIKAAEHFFKKNISEALLQEIEEKRFHYVEYKSFFECKDFEIWWPEFKVQITDEPRLSLNVLGLGLHEVLSTAAELDSTIDFPMVYVRIINYEPVITLRNLKAGLYGKLASVRGTVIRVGGAKLSCTNLGFSCTKCGFQQSISQPDGIYKMPTSCQSNVCKSKSFVPLCSSNLTQSRSLQILKIQEIITDDQREGGRVPRTVECEVTDDLVDTCGPGDSVTITAIVKVRNNEENSRKSKSSNLYSLYLEGVSVVNAKGQGSRGHGAIGIEFSLKDYYAIQEIHNEKNGFRLMVNSVCPSVYGNEMVKAGLVLALVGGAGAGVASTSQSAHLHTRADPHLLIVGDPGLGKSHMLHACAAIAPRGVYVCGNTASSSGLTVTLCKEAGGDFALEAGALVLANHGACCIDEFDKMSTQHQALLEAMEQQTVSIAKGGVVCSLPARTSIVAAANPAGGHYNRAKTVAENLRMGQPLLSRFDLVFILLDKPNEQLDSLLSEHVMVLHAGGKKRKLNQSASLNQSISDSFDDTDKPLSEKLKLPPEEETELIPQALLRKYIAYVRKYVPNPKLSREAASVIQDFYLKLRQSSNSGTTPITTRQLQSLVRLTQARAKAELREIATESDAKDIVELMEYSMADTLSDEAGKIDFKRSRNGSGMSQPSQAKRLVAALQKKCQLDGKKLFETSELKKISSNIGLQVTDFVSFISILNTHGFLLKKGPNLYQLLTD